MKTTVLRASLLALAVGLLSGCATTEQLAEVKAIAEKAQATANTGVSKADAAAAAAADAMEAARRAESAAQAAQACCNEQKSRLDRALEDIMKK
jgi:hypothetical protein